MNLNKESLISIVLPVYNEEAALPVFIPSIMKILNEYNTEIILVDDGSTDDSWTVIEELSKNYNHIRGISFTRNFGHQAAIMAGLEVSKGDAVIMMDSDGQHPPEILPELIELWKKGGEVIQGVRLNHGTKSILKKITSIFFYKIFYMFSDVKLKEGEADFRLLSRKVVNKLLECRGPLLFLRGTIPWLGYKTEYVPFEVKERIGGKPGYSMTKSMRLSLHGLMSFSVLPLRMAIVIGAFSACLSFLYFIYVLVVWFAFEKFVVQGWASIISMVLLLGGIQLLTLGIVGEYLGKIFIAGLNRPSYVIKESGLKNTES